MKLVAAVCRVAGERVALVAVQRQAIEFTSEADRYVTALTPVFEDMPIVLVARDDAGSTRFYGREDLAQKLAQVPADKIPWQEIDAEV